LSRPRVAITPPLRSFRTAGILRCLALFDHEIGEREQQVCKKSSSNLIPGVKSRLKVIG
jgi:hypothetical protein